MGSFEMQWHQLAHMILTLMQLTSNTYDENDNSNRDQTKEKETRANTDTTYNQCLTRRNRLHATSKNSNLPTIVATKEIIYYNRNSDR